jgi:hypothetical protein
MGQYYQSSILAENKKTVIAFVYSHDYDNGLKLMEHSYIGNNFVRAFESLIKNKPQRVVWAGDYADKCKGLKTNVFDRCKDKLKVNPTDFPTERESRYVINHTKKQFVDKVSVPEITAWKGAKIHPLPLLTCEGNGRGGGDFRGINNYVGTWARDLISVESKKPKGYTEITPNFAE